MGLFFVGRLAGGVAMNYIQPKLVLLACAILTFLLPPHYDDSRWRHSPRVDGLHSRQHAKYVPRLPHPPHLLRRYRRLRRNEEELGVVPKRPHNKKILRISMNLKHS